jgi:two-component system, NarL family, response regulator LiaR
MLKDMYVASKETTLLYTRLSTRKREVLRLIADGLPDAQIAERLVISKRTVKNQVNNILSKLHVAERTQAAIYAWLEGIMDR